MKKLKKLILPALVIAACFVFIGVVNAEDEDNYTNEYVKIDTPAVKQVYYKGEKIKYNVDVTNPWSDYKAIPYVGIIKLSDTEYKELALREHDILYAGSKSMLKKSFNTKNIKPGKYIFIVSLNQILQDGSQSQDKKEQASKSIYIRTLKAPKTVKATKATKGIKISYKEQKGATKYNIYRSTKKTSGFKKVGTTTKTTFVNKKATKGKRYYYKVKSVRTVNNKIMSKYSKTVTAIAK